MLTRGRKTWDARSQRHSSLDGNGWRMNWMPYMNEDFEDWSHRRTKWLSGWVGRTIKKRWAPRNSWKENSGHHLSKHYFLCALGQKYQGMSFSNRGNWFLGSDILKCYCSNRRSEKASTDTKGTLSWTDYVVGSKKNSNNNPGLHPSADLSEVTLGAKFFFCKVRRVLLTSQGCCEDKVINV